MNSSKLVTQMISMSKRGFSASLYNYGASSNPKVYFTVSKDGRTIGDMVF